jgi:hypothetical protein
MIAPTSCRAEAPRISDAWNRNGDLSLTRWSAGPASVGTGLFCWSAGLDPGALVVLEVEGAHLAQALAGECRLHPVDALAAGADGAAPFVGRRPSHEQLRGLLKRKVRPLGPADSGLALEDPAALDTRDLATVRLIPFPRRATWRLPSWVKSSHHVLPRR